MGFLFALLQEQPNRMGYQFPSIARLISRRLLIELERAYITIWPGRLCITSVECGQTGLSLSFHSVS